MIKFRKNYKLWGPGHAEAHRPNFPFLRIFFFDKINVLYHSFCCHRFHWQSPLTDSRGLAVKKYRKWWFYHWHFSIRWNVILRERNIQIGSELTNQIIAVFERMLVEALALTPIIIFCTVIRFPGYFNVFTCSASNEAYLLDTNVLPKQDLNEMYQKRQLEGARALDVEYGINWDKYSRLGGLFWDFAQSKLPPDLGLS